MSASTKRRRSKSEAVICAYVEQYVVHMYVLKEQSIYLLTYVRPICLVRGNQKQNWPLLLEPLKSCVTHTVHALTAINLAHHCVDEETILYLPSTCYYNT